jgi:hypothetical protein
MHSSANHGENGALRRAGVADLFRRHRVDLVVAGHDHVYERGEERGLRYIVTGGGGAGLYALRTHRAYSQVLASQHHYVRVDVARDALSFVALRPDGSVLDRFTIRHPNALVGTPTARTPRPPPALGAPTATPSPTAGRSGPHGPDRRTASDAGAVALALGLGVALVAIAARRHARRSS